MFYPFLALAARSPTRQWSFRSAVAAHVLLLLGIVWASAWSPQGKPFPLLGHLLLCAGIVEGALLVGWRLTQMPKSQALEFLLVSPLRPAGVFLCEVLVGAVLLALVTLSGLPVLVFFTVTGQIQPWDILPVLLLPFTWGLLTGVWLTQYAYEPLWVRRLGEVLTLLLVLLYLVVGILAGEHLRSWLDFLGTDFRDAFLTGFYAFHLYNPFGIMQFWLEEGAAAGWDRLVWTQGFVTLLFLALLTRTALRLRGHFQERHYQPACDVSREHRGSVGERPLSWWAVKRVSEYSGRINLWLAGGFGILYAVYTVAGPAWPAWLGKRVFELCDGVGGIAGIATGLVLLAAVPAAFQYGLWDSNVQERCKRLELLLLTELEPADYWHAAAAASWSRGRGYFFIALLLWGSAAWAGQTFWWQVVLAVASALLLWAFSFTLGFQAFARGAQANGMGMFLTVGLPLITYALHRLHLPLLAELLMPGMVYGAASPEGTKLGVVTGMLLTLLATLVVSRQALHRCDRDLRRWYDLNQGRKVLT